MKTISKKILAMSLAILCTISSMGLDFGLVDPAKPILGVVADDALQVIKANTKTEYKVNIKNISSTVATNIRVTLKGEHPFRSDIANLSQRVTYINPNVTNTFVFNVTTSPTAESKIYEFDVLIEYSNFNEESYSETQKAYVKIENGMVEPILGIYSAKTGRAELLDRKSVV